jgi:hypothetical protein
MLGKNQKLDFSLRPIEVKEIFESEQVKQTVLTKTARELGMNKSTLWYQKKMLRERGSIRLYNISKYHFQNA